MENLETSTENWQVETGGQVFDSTFDEMTAWIAEGALLRIDRVRKGNLRWIEAGKVPQLIEFFNAKDAGRPIMPVITTTHVETLGVVESPPTAELYPPAGDTDVGGHPVFGPVSGVDGNASVSTPVSLQPSDTFNILPVEAATPPQAVESQDASDCCAMHPDIAAAWACDTCSNSFCKSCPTGYGANVKICPFCGAMCRSLAPAAVQTRTFEQNRRVSSGESFGFSDFGNALAYPFKFKFSLLVGAIMFAAFSIGSGAGGFGGIFAMVGGIVCLLCSNMLSFGVLANTVESFSQGKLDVNFMPSFDDFSIWDDVVHPFFLSIGVYISSFGPFLAVVLFTVFMVVGSVTNGMNGIKDDAARTIDPGLPYAAKAANQSQVVRDMIQNTKNYQQKRVEELNKGEIDGNAGSPPSADPENTQAGSLRSDPDEEEFDRTNKLIQENRKAQLESVVGKTPETKAKEQAALFKQILGYGLLFLLLGGITLLWGLFYFPAACAVAGYTQSFAATLNPTVGLDTIKRLGSTYALILLFGLILLIVSGFVSGVLNMAFLAFDLPGLGNVPAKFIGSMFGFYISVVFSCILGYALFKKADALELPS